MSGASPIARVSQQKFGVGSMLKKNGNNMGRESVFIVGKNFQDEVGVLSGYRVYINVAVGKVFHGTSASKVA
jgi:hypothetical protein